MGNYLIGKSNFLGKIVRSFLCHYFCPFLSCCAGDPRCDSLPKAFFEAVRFFKALEEFLAVRAECFKGELCSQGSQELLTLFFKFKGVFPQGEHFRKSIIQIHRIPGVLLDILSAGLHILAHQNIENPVCRHGILQFDPPKSSRAGIHGGLCQLLRVHFS